MKFRFLLFLFAALSSFNAQTLNKAKLDSLFSIIDSNNKSMGSFAIFENGKEIYSNSIGIIDLKTKIKSNPLTKYRIGSISKTFTSVIILQLMEEGKLTPDTKLSEYFPDFENSEKITISHLLQHRSGIYNFTNAEEYRSWMEKPISRDDLLIKMLSHKNVFQPDEKMEYSNSNYVLLSFIAEDIDKKSFAKILEDRIIKPLKLKNTYYGSKINTNNNEANSFKIFKEWEPNTETDMSVPVGAGAVVSNAIDLNIFINALFDGKLITKKSLDLMTTLKDNFGMGIFQMPFYDKTCLGHTGGIDGFTSILVYFPNEKVSVACLSNASFIPLNDILIGILSIYFNKEYKLPDFTQKYFVKDEDLDKYLGNYSGAGFPFKVIISKKDGVLLADAEGQPTLIMEPVDLHKFKFTPMKVEFEFVPDKNMLVLIMAQQRFELTREK